MSQDQGINFSELAFQSAVLDSLSAHIAVLDSTGKIVAVNESWKAFANANSLKAENACVGSNYLEACRSAALDPSARDALNGICGVIDGRRRTFYLKYPCHSPWEMRWFALRASPLRDHPNFVVVSHEDITEQVLARIAPRIPR